MREIPREKYVADCEGKKPRDRFGEIMRFLEEESWHYVLVLYGLYRTGKTTLMEQALARFPEEQCLFLETEDGDKFDDLEKILDDAEAAGKKYIVIDDVTKMEDFINRSAVLSDIYAGNDMKIILSGDDTVSFYRADRDELFDRDILVPTTYVPFAEYARLIGTRDIDGYSLDGYIRTGGLPPGVVYDMESAGRYLDFAVADNVSNSVNRDSHTRYRDTPVKGMPKERLRNIIEDFVKRYAGTGANMILPVVFNELEEYMTDVRMLSVTEMVTFGKTGDGWQRDRVEKETHIVPPVIEYVYRMEAERRKNPSCPESVLDGAVCEKMLKQIVLFDVQEALSEVTYKHTYKDVKMEDDRYDVFRVRLLPAGGYDLFLYDAQNNTHCAFTVEYGEDAREMQCGYPDFDEFADWYYGKRMGYAVLYTGEPFMASNGTPYLNVADFLISIDTTKDIEKTMEILTKDIPERDNDDFGMEEREN